ncbi:hypothetical protein MMC32_002112 [Xylographa parallela]|nr:hypothetical protein [Xylographa parallela]
MPYSLQNRNVLITGGSRGLGALVAEKFAAEGSHVAINYVANAERAELTARKIARQFGGKVVVIQGDMGVLADCEQVVREASTELGGLDVIVSNACWAVNVKGNMHLLRAALPIFNANPDGGVFLMTSSIAGIGQTGSSMAYSVTKAAGLQLMKCLAQTQGPKIRINAVLPGLLLTEWGEQFGEERIKQVKEKAVLKQETLLDDCADAFIMAAKNTSMTGQNIQIDSGLAIK